MGLYARKILLRNCGRFTHISSDFGSQYHTHTFVTSEALYASLTRGVTWRHPGRFIDLEEDAQKAGRTDYFLCDYDVLAKLLWFTPGIFVDGSGQPLVKQRGVTDKNDFNVVDEGEPGTGGNNRPHYVPTYGWIEGILPDHRLVVYALSPRREELEWFKMDQIFLLGKKRTMFQIVSLSDLVEGIAGEGQCTTGYLQLSPNSSTRFRSFEVLAATMRYVILRGTTREKVGYLEFPLPDGELCLPDFYLEQTPVESGSG